VDGSRLTLDTEWPVKLDILYAQPAVLAAPALLEDEQKIQTAEVNAKYVSEKNPDGSRTAAACAYPRCCGTRDTSTCSTRAKHPKHLRPSRGSRKES
jgi:hypothetical protein